MALYPKSLVIRNMAGGLLKYNNKSLCWGSDYSGFDPMAKLMVEKSKKDENLMHLRFGYTNTYLAAAPNKDIIAEATEPEEDTSKPSCTLFKIEFDDDQIYIGYTIQHVFSGLFVDRSTSSGLPVFITNTPSDNYSQWWVDDWEGYVKIPTHVAFKANNGMYLQGVWAEGHPYLQFQNDDPNAEECSYELTPFPLGYYRIKSTHFNQFWRRSPNWIWADAGETDDHNSDTLFYPFKIDDNTIALKNLGNQNFCVPLSADGKTNCLNAASSTMSSGARITVEELVLGIHVYDVKYNMEYARIYDEQPYVAGKTTAVNNMDGEDNVSVSLAYEDSSSYSFTRSLSITTGASMTIEADVLGIAKGAVEFSFSVTGAFEWNTTTTKTTTITATDSVPVPGKSTAMLSYVGTQASCDVPYTYTQKAISSTTGEAVITEEYDGIFTGVNCYNFYFQVDEIVPH